MSRLSWLRAAIALAAILALRPPAAAAQDAGGESAGAQGAAAAAKLDDAAAAAKLDDAAVLILPVALLGPSAGADASAFADALELSLVTALAEAGFSPRKYSGQPPSAADPPGSAAALARTAGALWAAAPSLELADKRLAVTLRIFEAGDGSRAGDSDAAPAALAAASAFSAYAGLSALPLMDEAARAAAAKAAAYRASAARGGGGRVQYRILVESPDEGATVSLGSPGEQGSVALGSISEGRLLLPYMPLELGSTIELGLSAADRLPSSISLKLGEEAPRVALPALRRVAKEELLVGTGPGRLLGLGATYRKFALPDWIFFFQEERLFAGYDFASGSLPLFHLESWAGFGSYVLFPPQSLFRMGACIGGGLVLSAPAQSLGTIFGDVFLVPAQLFLELQPRSGPGFWLSIRGAYAVGSGGLLAQGWLQSGGPDLSAGMLWRRDK